MFKNIRIEMLKQDVTMEQIAKALGVKLDTARLKINGKIGLDYEDINAIRALFKQNNDFEYLFEKSAS